MTNSKINICFISYREDFEVVLENFAEALLRSNNYEITLLGREGANYNMYSDSKFLKFSKINLPEFTHLSNYINNELKRLIFVVKAIKFINSNNFSIVHIDVSCQYFGLIKIFSRKTSRFIYHILSYPITESSFRRFKAKLYGYLQCLIMDKVIIQSKEIKDHWFGIKSLNKTIIIPVGFDKDKFFPIKSITRTNIRNRLNINGDYSLLVYSGEIRPHRKLENLIYAMSIVAECNPHTKLLFIGAGDSVPELKALAKSLALDELLIFTGYVPHNEVVNYIGAADIAISYIPINENFTYNPPLKTYEYLACGLPTIATQTIINQNIIDNGVNGILAKDTPQSIADSVISLLNNPEKRKYLSQNARSSVVKYDYNNLTSKHLIPLYKDLLEL